MLIVLRCPVLLLVQRKQRCDTLIKFAHITGRTALGGTMGIHPDTIKFHDARKSREAHYLVSRRGMLFETFHQEDMLTPVQTMLA